ncbi:MAG: UDP-N-acetylmuramoyl-L-alanine--D-glutamate ligase [Gammaproteobacteria bacterium]|nr:UDP-N-acetylmuramoyl-L-alanine--D-glutamate ligase [Gammaproteobacteria bacterium]
MPQIQSQFGKTLIVGLGASGLSAARYLAAQGSAAAVIDSRDVPPGVELLRQELPDTALFLGGFDEAVFDAADRLIVSPGVPLATPQIQRAIARGAEVIGDVELFARAVEAPVVAITGSNGKSSVTTLLGEMARVASSRVALGGNLGEPALDLLDPAVELYLLELSSFQLETTYSLRPRVAMVLNVAADHMDRYRDLDHYTQVKAGIYLNAEVGVFNRDDERVMAMSTRLGKSVERLFFTQNEPRPGEYGLCRQNGVEWLCRGDERLIAASEIKVPGRHNLANALASLAAGEALGLPMPAMLEGIRQFRGLPHRTQLVAEQDGVRWYNDSKGTNVGATIAALKGMHRDDDSRTVLIAGGEGKGADFSPLAAVVSETARAVILIGQDANSIAETLGEGASVRFAENMADAVSQAAELAHPGDRVLLSPACASFDMYPDYQQRGNDFVALVEGLAR